MSKSLPRYTLGEALREIAKRGLRYYVYILLDAFGKPLYVGKGTGKRIAAHEEECVDPANCTEKHEEIRRVWSAGDDVQYIFAGFTDEESKSHELERALIVKFGRRDLGTGILVNRSSGGEGFSPVWEPKAWEVLGTTVMASVLHPSSDQLAPPCHAETCELPLVARWQAGLYSIQLFWDFSHKILDLAHFDPDEPAPLFLRFFVGPELVLSDRLGVMASMICNPRRSIAHVLDRLSGQPQSLNGHSRLDIRFGSVDLNNLMCQRLQYHATSLRCLGEQVRCGHYSIEPVQEITESEIWISSPSEILAPIEMIAAESLRYFQVPQRRIELFLTRDGDLRGVILLFWAKPRRIGVSVQDVGPPLYVVSWAECERKPQELLRRWNENFPGEAMSGVGDVAKSVVSGIKAVASQRELAGLSPLPPEIGVAASKMMRQATSSLPNCDSAPRQ